MDMSEHMFAGAQERRPSIVLDDMKGLRTVRQQGKDLIQASTNAFNRAAPCFGLSTPSESMGPYSVISEGIWNLLANLPNGSRKFQ